MCTYDRHAHAHTQTRMHAIARAHTTTHAYTHTQTRARAHKVARLFWSSCSSANNGSKPFESIPDRYLMSTYATTVRARRGPSLSLGQSRGACKIPDGMVIPPKHGNTSASISYPPSGASGPDWRDARGTRHASRFIADRRGDRSTTHPSAAQLRQSGLS
jgi:hypothetical protein